MDPYFRVEVISQSPNPQQTIYAAMHQDYSEDLVVDEPWPDEAQAGEIAVKHLLMGDRGHYGPLEHPQITLNCGFFPHSVMQQARTHRVGISFDVQSMRYSGQRIADAAAGKRELEEVIYLRPVGEYRDRQGARYQYTGEARLRDLLFCGESAKRYAAKLGQGFSEEHARSMLPFDFRQHFVMSLNVRSFMHFMDLRSKKDAQLEIQQMCDLMWPHFQNWVPAIAQWYEATRLGKARLSP
jgi:thymidylate synthase (FAD)